MRNDSGNMVNDSGNENDDEKPPSARTGGVGGGRRKGDDIAERLLVAVGRVQRLLPALQRDAAGSHLAQQLWRAATSGGANYAEARGAESRADFIHKIRLATKELREALYWLQVVHHSNWRMPTALGPLVEEFDQLVAILVASARTAKSRSS